MNWRDDFASVMHLAVVASAVQNPGDRQLAVQLWSNALYGMSLSPSLPETIRTGINDQFARLSEVLTALGAQPGASARAVSQTVTAVCDVLVQGAGTADAAVVRKWKETWAEYVCSGQRDGAGKGC